MQRWNYSEQQKNFPGLFLTIYGCGLNVGGADTAMCLHEILCVGKNALEPLLRTARKRGCKCARANKGKNSNEYDEFRQNLAKLKSSIPLSFPYTYYMVRCWVDLD